MDVLYHAIYGQLMMKRGHEIFEIDPLVQQSSVQAIRVYTDENGRRTMDASSDHRKVGGLAVAF